MAEFSTTIYSKQAPTRANPSRLAPQNIGDGDVEFAVIPYTLAGTEAANDTINLCLLPVDAIPIPQLSSVTCADPGTTLTLDLGTAANPDGWMDGITLSNGGQVAGTSGTLPEWVAQTPIVADAGFANAGSAKVYATVASAASLTPGVILYFVLAWKRAK